ncbi:MAG: biopolymer transporter ExbD [Verrucomicrobia bacterium]|nr:biopolymer transporter ExbD [Verrucomicrobiota bacterium]
MFSQPLNLERFIRTKPETSLEVVPIVDILIIVVFFGLFSSPFVLPQGVEVGLELNENLISGIGVTAVLTVKRDNMLLFEGQNLKLSQFEEKARTYLAGEKNAALLVRLDPIINTETFLKICGEAKKAGFSKVLVAGEKEAIDLPTFQ